ncbi:hypothetical protein HL667_13925 [Bradyrhizobium sp. 83012]|uniref:Uncharacterized protein n=1 Tax=Bradyrhizobium aeschynomenes TaxID=2734909 RepID=A0ABX2CCZ9_9BRAD|nr:hypothetical protein [Bradyrhizobium aeschynomenes]NPU09428.1 hypothetical protein [Bradyrhizobium aeschynomenes]NPU66096.1 hypothetical protein [Bradyrhizobium aeschynomenes]NPV20750.1 hypothetical protein [Bradyrhizobium aeschynomenes]
MAAFIMLDPRVALRVVTRAARVKNRLLTISSDCNGGSGGLIRALPAGRGAVFA